MTVRDKARILFPYLFIVLVLFLLFPPFFYANPAGGIDNSFGLAVHLIYKYQLVFGRDFVFTVGPLAILDSRLPVSINLFVYLFFDLYFLCTLFFLMKDLVKKHFSPALALFIFLGILISPYDHAYQRYFLFFLYFLFSFIREPGKRHYFIQTALLSILCYYYKGNVGITAIFLFVLTGGYLIIRQKLTLRTGMIMLTIYLLAILATGYFLHVDMMGYLCGSLQIIDGYSEAMGLLPGDRYAALLTAAIALVLIIVFFGIWLLVSSIRRKEGKKNADALFILSLLALTSFVIFKSAFVRPDEIHIPLFFNLVWGLSGLICIILPPGAAKRTAICFAWVTLTVSSWAFSQLSPKNQYYLSLLRLDLLPAKAKQIGVYCNQLADYNQARKASDRLESIPNVLKDSIGIHTVDIVPLEISRIYFNGLRYDPRPVVQSYSAYNPYLDGLNEQKYLSPDAPDYILFSLAGIDGRLGFFDEPRNKLAILGRYALAGKTGPDLLLRKRAVPEDLQGTGSPETPIHGQIGQEFPIKKSADLQYARIFVNYSFRGHIKRLLYKVPPLTITLFLASGDSMSYPITTEMLADGLIINKYVGTEDDFRLLMLSEGRMGNDIIRIRIDRQPGNRCYGDELVMEAGYYRWPLHPEPQRIEDSLDLARIMGDFDKYQPSPANPAVYEQDSIRNSIESIRSYSPLIRITGWAFRKNADNSHIIVQAALRSGDSLYVLPTRATHRKDVPFWFKRNDISGSSFEARVGKTWLSGKYQVELIVRDTLLNKGWIRPTDRQITIQK